MAAPREGGSLTTASRAADDRRRRMVERLAEQGISDPAVLEAMARVPREAFLPEALRGRAYEDTPLPIGHGQTMSQPWAVARLAELLAVERRGKVLEIGSGSGYQAAVLAEMGLRVFSIERHAQLAREASARLRALGYLAATVKHFDGTYGWAAMAPFDGIVSTAGGPEIPGVLVQQLRLGGRLVIPIDRGRAGQRLVVVTRTSAGSREEDHGPASFVPLIGRYGFRPAPPA
ncbi:MAG: protein-L-isoaspartate(D-aspartate) O-methyltransferase [Acidobacteriota bacterium]|nr:MAG: protein-L-isoaspartate(D-aspartate) O-methyltransferase [Acidobacteriota bacterium]